MDTLEAIRTIRAVREFESRPVSDEVITQILKAGRWTGSSKNTQPWQFIVVKDREMLNRLADCGNYTDHLRRANFAIVVLTERAAHANYDAGRCCQNMMLAAWNDGVGSCIATMHRQADAERVLGIPREYELQQVISFGYPAPGSAPMRPARAGGRKPLEEMVFYNSWGEKTQKQ